MIRILLIDDDESFRKMLRMTLQRANYEVMEACNGNEAVSLFRSQPADLVITDLIMPDKEGLETIQELRQGRPLLKIIAMSGGGRIDAQDYLKIAERLGASRTLAKPFTQAEFLTAIRESIG
jgi:DNA-binding response OmpR family regulator